jgi:hypothetical protein
MIRVSCAVDPTAQSIDGLTRRATTKGLARRTTVGALIFALAMTAAAPTAAAQACQPVPGNNLEKFYPVMPGWTRGMPKSETDQDEAVSRTTVDFDRATETISVELMDSCRNADVLQLIRETLKTFPPATRGTIQRHTTVNGFPAYEEFTAESGHGEIHVLVAGRFMVKVTAESSTLPTLQNAARLVPMAGLAALR